MKKNVLPDSQKKRKLLFDQKAPRELIISSGELFLREGRVNEAAELFTKASHTEGLEQLKALAVEEGDSFLYEVASKGSGEGGGQEVWETLGKNAMEREKFSHAVRAFRKAENAELLKAAEEALKEAVSVDKA
jgi:hypothetical protein